MRRKANIDKNRPEKAARKGKTTGPSKRSHRKGTTEDKPASTAKPARGKRPLTKSGPSGQPPPRRARGKKFEAPVKPAFKKSKFENDDKFRGRNDKRVADEDKPLNYSREKPELSGLTRLNKYISNSGICSRREADKLIEAGAVTVNGEVVSELGYKISPDDVVQYGGTPVRTGRNVYVLLNKPKDYITTTDDPMNRRTVMALVRNAGRERIYPVGRLDRATTGLLLLTNDGDITKKLTHPSHQIKKIYHVELDKSVKLGDMKKIREGVELEDGDIKVDVIDYVGLGDNKKVVGVELHSGRNRIVRRLFEHLGYEVQKLDRVYFAGLTKKDLPRGRWRFLTEMEVNMLRMQTGKKKSA